MRKKITTTTAANPLALSQGKKLFMIKSGRYSGRLIMLMQTSATEIKYSYADRPYTTWSTPAAIARETGVDKGRLSRFIRGQRSLTLPAVDALARYLGLELSTKQRRKKR